ncbi:MAG: glycosyltransferase [Verrucomicrobia bacterium]|nr:glycosyltransferase [Verrucomicrobiota bacterium]
MILFVATTIDAKLGGIARSVPALAVAIAGAKGETGDSSGWRVAGSGLKSGDMYGGRVVLVAPKAEVMTVDAAAMGEVELCVCEGRRGVVAEVERRLQSKPGVELIYQAGVWDPLNRGIARLARRYEVPMITSTRSMLDPWALCYHPWRKRLAWLLYAKRDLLSAKALHATAELEARHIRSALGERCPPVIVVPNGLHLPPPVTAPVQREKTILFLSRINPKKGLPDLIRAFGSLHPAGWKLLIVGNDDAGHLPGCQALAAQQPNKDSIVFQDQVADAHKVGISNRRAALFVLPSYSENFGLVIGEALACDTPVITTTATPWAEFAGEQASDLGLHVIEPGYEPLLKKLNSVLQQLEQSPPRLNAAYWIQQNFSWEAIGQRFLRSL